MILSSAAVIQSGRKANKSLLLIGFQLSSNQFVLQNAGRIFNYCILPDTREMEGFFISIVAFMLKSFAATLQRKEEQ